MKKFSEYFKKIGLLLTGIEVNPEKLSYLENNLRLMAGNHKLDNINILKIV